MKKLVCFLLFLSVFTGLPATWTIHCTKDYNATFNAAGPNGLWGTTWGVQWAAGAYWDYWNDTTYPEYAYSGTWFYDTEADFWDTVIGYADTQIVTTPDTEISQVYFSVWDSGPEYAGGSEIYDTSGMYQPGEYWIDFAADRTARISTMQPADFGKWAWDGSINPSWVETLVVKRGKGHKK